jgi:hypothetical protein
MMIDLRKFDSTAARTWERGEHGDAEHLMCDGAPIATIEWDGVGAFTVLYHVNDSTVNGFRTAAEAREFAEKFLQKHFSEIGA